MTDIDLKAVRTVYFIGIGGIGISAIARMLLLEGKKVYGSDRGASKVTEELQKAGATIFIGQTDANIKNIEESIDLFVYTVAIPDDSPELIAAKSSGPAVLSYPQMLGLISKDTYTIAISGTHGKTTTTAMVAKIMIDAGLDPSVIVGSLLNSPKKEHSSTNFIAGKSKYLVVEADEYKKSFHHLHPSILLINNLDEDHLDFYKDLADIQDSFAHIARLLPADGFLVANTEDLHVVPVLAATKAAIIPYNEELLGGPLKMPGNHNRSNAKAALAVARVLGIDTEQAKKSLAEFDGVWRRFEYKGETSVGAKVYDDYAHNPQKIKALLQGAREHFGADARIIVVFQPHLYSRTKLLFDLFTEAFDDADIVLLAPIFPAREAFDPTISSNMLAEAIQKKASPDIRSLETFEEIEASLKQILKAQDILITIGAGEAYKIGEALLKT